MTENSGTNILLERIAQALERISPKPKAELNVAKCDAFIWDNNTSDLLDVENVNRIPFSLFFGIDQVRNLLLQNTLQFAEGYSANNALLWGARGMGKSSIVKAIHAHINEIFDFEPLKLIEIHREDIDSLPQLMSKLVGLPQKFILFCDDLSFDGDDTSYKALKAALDGGIDGRPANVVLYATSNRRHLMPRDMIENERSTSINPSEAVEEKVSLSDRFGLWLGFHTCNQDEYLEMVEGYIKHFDLEIPKSVWQSAALEWAITRGNRSGRSAWQFIQDLAGKQRVVLRP